MRKMSFRVTGSDAALETRIRGKSKEIAAARSGYFVRTIVEDVSLRCRFSLSHSHHLYLSRDVPPEGQKAEESGGEHGGLSM